MKFNVVQFGARRHYAVPRILYEAGLLRRFYTDICAVQGWPRLLAYVPETRLPKPLRRLRGRVPEGIPVSRISSYPDFALRHQFKRNRSLGEDDALRIDVEMAQQMDEKILRTLPDEPAAVYVLHRGSGHLLRRIKERGGFCVLEQTAAPIRIDRRLVLEEHDTFPGWRSSSDPLSDLAWFADIEELGWQLADLIICGSEYVRQGIGACGGPTERCRVVPSGIDGRFSGIERPLHDGPLRVLTAGAVGLRKGSPYVLAVAKSLKGRAVFRMVGPFHGGDRVLRQLQDHLQLTGQVPRSQIAKQFQWADVFFLPSVSEGSAMAVYEALSAGLPVVCTPNAGSVVRDGYNGYVVPIRDVGRMCDSIAAIADDRQLLAQLSENARNSRADWSFEGYRERLLKCLASIDRPELTSGGGPSGFGDLLRTG